MTLATRSKAGLTSEVPRASSSKLKRKVVDADNDELAEPRPNKRYKTRSVQRSRRLKYRQRQGYFNTDAAPGKMSLQERNEKNLLRPDKKYFFLDGNFCLVVEDVKFLVHVHKIAAAGGLFADFRDLGMLRAEDGDCIDGIPSVEIPQTTVIEMRYLLAILYDDVSISTFISNGKPWFHWDLAKNLIPIVDRLNLDNIHKKIVAGLEMLFPSKGLPAPFKSAIGGIQTERQKRFHRVFPFEALDVFSRYSDGYSYRSFLPMAYYHASQLSIEDIIHGVQDGDKLLELDPGHITVLLKGRETVINSKRGVTFYWLEERLSDPRCGPRSGSAGCQNVISPKGKEYCYNYFQRLHRHFLATNFLDGHANALEGLNENAKGLFKYYMCKPCYESVLKDAEAGLKTNWERLPGYFGLESWEAVSKS